MEKLKDEDLNALALDISNQARSLSIKGQLLATAIRGREPSEARKAPVAPPANLRAQSEPVVYRTQTPEKKFDDDDWVSVTDSARVPGSANQTIFAGGIFAFDSLNAYELRNIVEEGGGATRYGLSSECTHLVSANIAQGSVLVNRARAQEGVIIVSEAFIHACVQAGRLLTPVEAGEKPLPAVLQSPEPAPTIRVPYASASSPKSLSSAFASISISSAPIVAEPVEEVDYYSREVEPVQEDTYVAPATTYLPSTDLSSASDEKEDQAHPEEGTKEYALLKYDLLQSTDIETNHNKYYAMEIHHFTGSNNFRVFTHYGRTDDLEKAPMAGVRQSRPCPTFAEASKQYAKLYKDKTSGTKGYKPLELASSKIGSAQLKKAVRESYVKQKSSAPAMSAVNPADLSKPVVSLVEHLYEEATQALTTAIAVNITSKGIETPLGILTLAQIAKGERVLSSIEALIAKSENVSKSNPAIVGLSGEFYTHIPHRLGRSRVGVQDSVISTMAEVEEKRELLQLMEDMLTINASGGSHSVLKEGVGFKYVALRCSINHLPSDSANFSRIRALVEESQVRDTGIRVKNVFAIQRPSEAANFVGDAISNHMQLFHASRPSNFVGILSRGLLMPKKIVAQGGKLTNVGWLGSGLYFAENACTSTRYAAASSKSTRFLLVSTVACGTPFQTSHIDSTLVRAPPGTHSVHGLSERVSPGSDFEDDEWVVYDNNQVTMSYLVEFESDEKRRLPPPSKLGERKAEEQARSATAAKPSASSDFPKKSAFAAVPASSISTGFGASSSNASSSSSSGFGSCGFGVSQPATGFGDAPQGFGGFGAPQPATGFGGFGAVAQPATGFGGFGAQPATGFGGFGAPQPATGFGGFGGFGVAQPATGFGGFGAPQPATGFGGGFGVPTPTTGLGFGTQPPQPFGGFNNQTFGGGFGTQSTAFGTSKKSQKGSLGFGAAPVATAEIETEDVVDYVAESKYDGPITNTPAFAVCVGIKKEQFPIDADAANTWMKQRDDHLRQIFAANRGDSELQDLYVHLIDVYHPNWASSFIFEVLSAQERVIPRVLAEHINPKPSIGSQTIVPQSQFNKNWEVFTQGQLKGLDWSNVFVAGGCVMGCLMPSSKFADASGFKSSDIDLFLYGLTAEQATEKVRHIYQIVQSNRPATEKAPEIIRTSHAITILGQFPSRHIQIVLRLYLSPAEVLLGFDIDACTAGYNGTNVVVTPRCRRALNKQYCLVDLSRRSLTYEVRLFKYSKRGFAIAVPGFRPDGVDERLFQSTPAREQGLARLLLYSRQEETRMREKGKIKMADNWEAAELEVLNSDNPDKDYDNVLIPFGPSWHQWKIMEVLTKRDMAQFFKHKQHKHIFVSGLDGVIDGYSPWCKICRQDRETGVKFVHRGEGKQDDMRGPIRWLEDNPGRQLMTGSFHPLPEADWDKHTYDASEVQPANSPGRGKKTFISGPRSPKSDFPAKSPSKKFGKPIPMPKQSGARLFKTASKAPKKGSTKKAAKKLSAKKVSAKKAPKSDIVQLQLRQIFGARGIPITPDLEEALMDWKRFSF